MIDPRLVAKALIDVDTSNFERFAQVFYGDLQDRNFVPLGGVHDGGAEGFDAALTNDPELFVDEAATSFLQVSKEVSTRGKIRKTHARLVAYGRNPKALTYITSQTVKDIDKDERVLSDELGCRVAIRDAKFIEIYINSSEAIQAAFNAYLLPSISYLFNFGESDIAQKVPDQFNKTLAVFLRQEVERRHNRSTLLEAVSDSLILWALRDTDADPTKPKAIDRAEILRRIETALPTAKAFIRATLDHRLGVLSAKDAPGGRQIRHYRGLGQFCLPYETRKLVAVENADDDLLKHQVSCAFEDRLAQRSNEDTEAERESIVKVCHSTLESVFEHQGLKVAQFVTDADMDDELFTDVGQIVSQVVAGLPLTGDIKTKIRRHVILVLRGTFYMSTAVERRYLDKLSRTYVLLLLLKNEPKIVEFFSSMAGSFDLYLGTDIIIRSLSELYLHPESQTTINLLRILKAAGSKLILTEKAVEEVATHIRRQMLEFENHYERNVHRISLAEVEYIDRLLIRSFFYAKLAPVNGVSPPKNWRDYLSQFCNPSDVVRNSGDRELANYLMRRFELSYESEEEMRAGIEEGEIEQLAAAIRVIKEEGGYQKSALSILAYNDALQVLRIYQKRRAERESSPGNPFGFKTWWLTQDGKVRRAARDVVRANQNQRFMMRPELLLHYIAMSPSKAEVHASYESIFPTALGVRLSSGLRDAEFKKVMRDASEISKVDDARAAAMVTEMTEKLKADVHKQFDAKW
ncbi:hypothetical protein [Rhizorhabdus phycosphaerae]|uniref:hypothetical protein n=1 Tax=Rhizorhabdus phycosphaerae TaxID=2711156 RepID=UPI0013EE3F0F|nr:hypothetical protein [Rhizorhabdus phycosphaerae]